MAANGIELRKLLPLVVGGAKFPAVEGKQNLDPEL
jgi:hypothetical protein